MDAEIFRPLKDARAVDLAFGRGVVWRLVYAVNESQRSDRVLALAKHDEAYAQAARRHAH